MLKPRKRKSYIYFVDRHRSIFEGMLARFRNTLKYSLKNFSALEGLINELNSTTQVINRTRVAILVIDHKENMEVIENEISGFVTTIKKIDSEMNLIVVAGKNAADTVINVNPPASYSLVQNNDNAILKVTNLIMGMISRESLEQKYISARRSVILFSLFVLVSTLLGLLFFLL